MTNKKELETMAINLAQAAYDKKGMDIRILDLEGISSLADFFIFVTATNKKQAQAIADEMSDKGAEVGIHEKAMEGYREGEWVLVDFGDIVAHIFTGEHREFYGLENLWNDAKEIPFEGV